MVGKSPAYRIIRNELGLEKKQGSTSKNRIGMHVAVGEASYEQGDVTSALVISNETIALVHATFSLRMPRKSFKNSGLG
jgi:hypothetical protein